MLPEQTAMQEIELERLAATANSDPGDEWEDDEEDEDEEDWCW